LSSGNVWLASRNGGTITSASMAAFSVKYVHSNGYYSSSALANINSSGNVTTFSHGYGVRPIITLKSGLTVSGGDGSPSNPYVLTN